MSLGRFGVLILRDCWPRCLDRSALAETEPLRRQTGEIPGISRIWINYRDNVIAEGLICVQCFEDMSMRNSFLMELLVSVAINRVTKEKTNKIFTCETGDGGFAPLFPWASNFGLARPPGNMVPCEKTSTMDIPVGISSVLPVTETLMRL